ncbi:MAG: hypothetical protein ACXWB2_04265 [Acidimicrobiales bacterium]
MDDPQGIGLTSTVGGSPERGSAPIPAPSTRLSRAGRRLRSEPLKALLIGGTGTALVAFLVVGYVHFERYHVVGSYEVFAQETCSSTIYVPLTRAGSPISTVGPSSGALVPVRTVTTLRAGSGPARITVSSNDAGHLRFRMTTDAGDSIAMNWISGRSDLCTG